MKVQLQKYILYTDPISSTESQWIIWGNHITQDPAVAILDDAPSFDGLLIHTCYFSSELATNNIM